MGPTALNPTGKRRGLLARDVLAGITVALVLIPQALAYARVAGMPSLSGLYAAALPPLVAALFASSPYLQTGPVALTSLLTFGALAGRAPVGSPEYVELGIVLALVVGLTRLLLGLLRGGVVAHLMSEPALLGFIPAGAILIAASQVPAVLGTKVDGSIVVASVDAALKPADWDWRAIAIALAAAAIVIGGRRVHRFFPGVLVALILALLYTHAIGYSGAVVGTIPVGLPPLPSLSIQALPDLFLSGVVIAIVGFAEPASIARTYATRERRAWDPNRELVSQGAANVAAALSSAYPVGGSLSRTSLNYNAGAVTRLSGAITGLAVLAFLPFANVLAQLPTAVLAAIVISSVIGLIRFRPIVALWGVSRPQFAVATATFALTLLAAPHVERGIVAGVTLAIAVHLARELTLRFDVTITGTTLVVRPAGVLWFATAPDLHERLIGILGSHQEAEHVRLELDGLGRIDITGAMALNRIVDDVRAAGLSVELARVPQQSQRLLHRHAVHSGNLQ